MAEADYLARNPKNDPAVRTWKREYDRTYQAYRDYVARQRPLITARLREAQLRQGHETSDPQASNARLCFLKEYEKALAKEVERLDGEERGVRHACDQDGAAAGRDRPCGGGVSGGREAGGAAEPRGSGAGSSDLPRNRRKQPKTKDEKKRIAATGLAAMGSFSLVLLGVTWWEVRARRISTVQEVSQGLGLRLMGALPALPEQGTEACWGDPRRGLRVAIVAGIRI